MNEEHETIRDFATTQATSPQVKHILITGARSYLGTSFEAWAKRRYGEKFFINTIDLRKPEWEKSSFYGYDAILHVAGIAHQGLGGPSSGREADYYAVNTELAVRVAQKAKTDGVRQFLFVSSMSVYGEKSDIGIRIITKTTPPSPTDVYGDSKLQAERKIVPLSDENFRVAILRPPMIYGNGCKGNYPRLAKLARIVPIFPDIDNVRSMLYIDNFCEFVCQILLRESGGTFFPQNLEYVKTSAMVVEIARTSGKRIWLTRLLNPWVIIVSHLPNKIGKCVRKAFGSMVYDMELSRCGFTYCVANFPESIIRSEKRMRHGEEMD